MRFSFWALFASAALASDCTPGHCVWGEDYDDGICMTRTDEYLKFKACPGLRTSCPISKDTLKQSEIKCDYWYDYQMWASESWKGYLEFSLKALGETCEPGNNLMQCSASDGLVCYCSNSSNCSCVDGISPGDECSTYGVPCVDNYVCNLKVCTLHHSLQYGDQVDNADACSGGNLKYNYDRTGLCLVGYETFGGLPKKCTTDLDCISNNGLNYSECVCGLNEEGDSYCSLQFEDEPMMDMRKAEENADFEDYVYYRFLVENYPLLQGTMPECLPNVWKDYGVYLEEDWALVLTGSAVLLGWVL
jgi:hypothetical protein